MLHSLEKIFYDGSLCLVAEKPLQDEQSLELKASDRPRKWTLCFCKEKSVYTMVNGLKKFNPIYLATQATVENPKPFYVVEKDGQFMTTQGYPVVYIGKVLDDYDFKDAEEYFKKLFNNNENVYRVFFEKIFVPAVGSGIPASEMHGAQRAFSAAQSPRNLKKQQKKQQQPTEPIQ